MYSAPLRIMRRASRRDAAGPPAGHTELAQGRSRATKSPRPAGAWETLRLARLAGGGFQLEGPDGWALRAIPSAGGLTVQGSAVEGWFLKKEGTRAACGHVLLESGDGDARELARTMRESVAGHLAGTVNLVTQDGRLFRIVSGPARDPRLELTGWEVHGAYLVARPRVTGWRITRTAAGRELGGAGEILVAFSAEILDAEDPESGF